MTPGSTKGVKSQRESAHIKVAFKWGDPFHFSHGSNRIVDSSSCLTNWTLYALWLQMFA